MVLAGQGCFSSSLFFSLSLLPPPSQVELPTLRWLQFECPHSARSLAPWYCMVLRLLERFWCIPPNSAYLHFQVGRYLSREICLQVNFLPAFHHSLLFPLLIFSAYLFGQCNLLRRNTEVNNLKLYLRSSPQSALTCPLLFERNPHFPVKSSLPCVLTCFKTLQNSVNFKAAVLSLESGVTLIMMKTLSNDNKEQEML